MRGVLKVRRHTKSGGGGGHSLRVRYEKCVGRGGGGAIRFGSNTKSGGGGGDSLRVRYERWGGGIPLFGTKKILYR